MQSRKPETCLMPSPKCTLARQYMVRSRYTPLPRAGIGNAVAYDRFRTGLFLRCLLNWTDEIQMLHIISTAAFKGPLTALRLAEGCSKSKLTYSSGPSPSLGSLLYVLSTTPRLLLISSFLPVRHTTLLDPSNVFRAICYHSSRAVNHATSGHCLPSLQPSIPSCTNMKCSNLVANPLLDFRSPLPVSIALVLRVWQPSKHVLKTKFPS